MGSVYISDVCTGLHVPHRCTRYLCCAVHVTTVRPTWTGKLSCSWLQRPEAPEAQLALPSTYLRFGFLLRQRRQNTTTAPQGRQACAAQPHTLCSLPQAHSALQRSAPCTAARAQRARAACRCASDALFFFWLFCACAPVVARLQRAHARRRWRRRAPAGRQSPCPCRSCCPSPAPSCRASWRRGMMVRRRRADAAELTGLEAQGCRTGPGRMRLAPSALVVSESFTLHCRPDVQRFAA